MGVGGLLSTTFVKIYIKIIVLICSFQVKRHNSSIQDGMQDGCHI